MNNECKRKIKTLTKYKSAPKAVTHSHPLVLLINCHIRL